MDSEPPPAKRLREMSAGPADEKMLSLVAKKSSGGVTVEVSLAESATVGDLAAHLAEREGCDAALVTLVCRGKVLGEAGAGLLPLLGGEAAGKAVVVYIVRKPAAAAAAPAAQAPAPAAQAAGAAGPPQAGAAAAPGAPASGAAGSTGSAGSAGGAGSAAAAPAAAAGAAAAPPPAGGAAKGDGGRRVLLLLRHGQCCHQDEHDEMKALTGHGQKQAEESARYVSRLFDAGQVPQQRALLHSTSRRARETAAKLPQELPGLEVWNAGLLRETDPTSNPLRAEEVFQRLFAAPAAGAADTLIVVAHNNIILYWLMRAAGVPVERAAQAWSLFHLRHASVTRVDVYTSGARQIVSVGAAGHVPHAHVTWNNIAGADMAAWKGGGAERRKFNGRMLVLVRQVGPDAQRRNVQIEAVAAHIKGLSEYMVSGHLTVTCTAAARETAAAIAQHFKSRLQQLPDSVAEQPEAAFLQFFKPPSEHGRDTVVLVAEDVPVLYWLLRALHMSPEEARAMIGSYRISHASVTLLNMRSDGSSKVVAVGDTGHLPLDCIGA